MRPQECVNVTIVLRLKKQLGREHWVGSICTDLRHSLFLVQVILGVWGEHSPAITWTVTFLFAFFGAPRYPTGKNLLPSLIASNLKHELQPGPIPLDLYYRLTNDLMLGGINLVNDAGQGPL